MDYKNFIFSVENHIADVSINRPEKANSLDENSWKELGEIFNYCENELEVRVIILRAEGDKIFSAGIDLAMLAGIAEVVNDNCEGRAREKLRKYIKSYQEVVSKLETCGKPVIAAVHGGCIGAGLDLICAADMRFCTSVSYFSIKEIDMAIVADFGTLQRLPKLIGDGKVRELAYTGRNMDANEAEKLGFVNSVFADREILNEEILKIALTIAFKSPITIRGIKQNILFSRDHSVADGLEYVATWNAATLLSADLKKVFQAQASRQKPEFEN